MVLRKVRRLMKFEAFMDLVAGRGFAEVEEGAGDGGPGGEEDRIGISGFGLADFDEGGG